MKLLLINPYFGGEAYYYPPLELGLIGTYVKDNSDCEVEIIDPVPQNLSEKQVLDKVKEVDVVGLTCFTERRFQCFDLAEKIKQTNPNCKLVVGGPHVFTLDKQILQHYPFIDILVRGEGEGTMLEIVKDRPYKEILGITWKNNGKIVRNPDRPFINNIDNLYIDYSLLPPPDKYPKDYEAPEKLQKLNHLYMLVSRGCPYRCTFCGGPMYWKGMRRVVSPQEVVRRMEYLASQYDVRYFRFGDGLFIADDKWSLRFGELLKKSKLNVSFRIDTRVGISREVLKMLRRAGCAVISLGIESGSERILKMIKKLTTREQMIKTIRKCKELGYWTIGTFIVGLPGENQEDFKKTLELVKLVDLSTNYSLTIYPNTTIYKELKQKGELTDEIWFDRRYDRYSGRLFYCKEYFTNANFYAQEMEKLRRYMFYYHSTHNPKSILRRRGLLKGMKALLILSKNIPSKRRVIDFYRKLRREGAAW